MNGRTGGYGDARGDGGFALLVTLLALVAVSVTAAGAVFVARSERRISHNHRAAVEALEVARGGLSGYLSVPGDSAPPRTVPVGPDTARVDATRLLFLAPDSLEVLYRVTARGVRAGPGKTPAATRTVSTLALAGPGRLRPAGAIAAGGPVRVASGPSVTLDGSDACGGPAGATAGIAVGPGRLHGALPSADGDPPIDDRRPPDELLRDSGIDSAAWAGLRVGWPAPPDYSVRPSRGWPARVPGWPVIRLEGGAPVLGSGHGGRGTIIAPGDLALRRGFRWEGLVLVGGTLAAVDSAVVRGAVLSGLNVHDGALPDTTLLGGGATFRFDACAARRAASELFDRLAEKPGSRFTTTGR